MFDMFDVWTDNTKMKINVKQRKHNNLSFKREIGYCVAVDQIVKVQVVSHVVLKKSVAKIAKILVGQLHSSEHCCLSPLTRLKKRICAFT